MRERKEGRRGLACHFVLFRNRPHDGRLAGGIAAAAMRLLQRKITYRCKAAGIEVIMAPPGFASSQICSGCGNRKTGKMRLQDEEIYECHGCGLVIDRDVNAAINLKHYGESIS